MIRPKKRYPLREYVVAKKTPVVCKLKDREFMVPLLYDRDVGAFIRDLFDQEEISRTYGEKEKGKEKKVKIGEYEVMVPYKWATGKLDHQIINRMLDIATLKYNSAVRTAKARDSINIEAKDKEWLTLNSEKIEQQFNETMDFFGEKGRTLVHAFNKLVTKYGEKGVRRGLNLGAKVVTSPVLLAAVAAKAINKDSEAVKKILKSAGKVYQNIWDKSLIDAKKSEQNAQKIDKFLDNVYDQFSHWSGPLIKKAAIIARKKYQMGAATFKNEFDEKRRIWGLWGTLGLSAISGLCSSFNKNESSDNKHTPLIENADKNSAKDDSKTIIFNPIISTQIRYTITDQKSFEEAFDASLPMIHRALLPTEWFSDNGYSDNNCAVSNTVGVGLWWYPADGNYESSEWIHTKTYLRDHPNTSINYEQAMDLTKGWFKCRSDGYVIKDMGRRLVGCKLAPNELAAIASVYYNDESCGKQLCNFVKKHYNDPMACAQYITNLRPKNPSYEVGIRKRHYHEALYYLNYNDYCTKVMSFNVRSGINSNGKFFITTPVTHLNLVDYRGLQNEIDLACAEKSKCLGKKTDELINKMCAYNPIAISDLEKVTSISDFLDKEVKDPVKRENMTRVAHYDNKLINIVPQSHKVRA